MVVSRRLRIVLWIPAVLLILSCGREPTAEEREAFGGYVERFNSYSGRFGRASGGGDRVAIVFGRLREEAVCEQGFLQSPRITVNRTSWESRTDVGKEILILHELGHCALGRNHTDETMRVENRAAPVPKSLMHSRAVHPTVYRAFQDHYLRELFSAR